MSLVGPRPVVPAEVEKYGEAAGLFLSVKPGMTGHWQVSGRSELQAYDKRVELDLEYIRDQSLGNGFRNTITNSACRVTRKRRPLDIWGRRSCPANRHILCDVGNLHRADCHLH